VAATIVLSVSVVLELSRHDNTEPSHQDEKVAQAPATAPAPSPTPAPAEMARKRADQPPAPKPAPPSAAGAAAPSSRPESAAAPEPRMGIASTENVERERRAAADSAARMAKQEEAAAQDKLTAGALAKSKEEKIVHDKADVISVVATGQPGAYEFTVSVRSPDTGCQQYADWWEVVSEDGKLLYRRVLLHSHVNDQPFTRSGGPVPIKADTSVWVRAHMNTGGYGGAALKGTVAKGFVRAEPPAQFAAALAKQPPLPQGCDF
jgi:hypothetical protein